MPWLTDYRCPHARCAADHRLRFDGPLPPDPRGTWCFWCYGVRRMVTIDLRRTAWRKTTRSDAAAALEIHAWEREGIRSAEDRRRAAGVVGC